MSGVGGLFYFDRRPIGSGLTGFLGTLLDESGHDGGGQHVSPGLLMMLRALHVTPEDRLERQPATSQRGTVVTWDGRLDNRDDLLNELWRDVAGDATDVALALAAYDKWGEDAFARLIGDWSLVIWDSSRHRLVMATDYTGNRALYYSADRDRVIWASSLRVMLALLCRCSVSPAFVIGYLTSTIPPGVTPYDEIFAVRPAHSIAWSQAGARCDYRFWDYPVDVCRYQRLTEYADRLRLLFCEGVRARMRSVRPVWAEQSGGLDSSTIVCTAHRLLQARAVAAPRLATVSYSSAEAPQERMFIREIEAHCQLRTHHLSIERLLDNVDAERQWITPFHPDGLLLREYAAISTAGDHVLLSGYLGDLVMGNTVDDSVSILGSLAAGRLGISLAMAREWSRSSQRPIWHTAGVVAAHLAPVQFFIRRQLWSGLSREALFGHGNLTDAIAERFLLRSEFTDLWRQEASRRAVRVRSFGLTPNRRLLSGLVACVDSGGLQVPSEYPGVALTFPFTHRPLVSYIMSLPAGLMAAPGRPRRLMRQAFDCLVPRRVLDRFSKGHVVDPFRLRDVQRFARIHCDAVDDLRLVACGYLDRARLRAELASIAVHGVKQPRNLKEIVRLESWLRTQDQERPGRGVQAAERSRPGCFV